MLSRDQDNVQYYLGSGTLLYEAIPHKREAPLREALFAIDSAIASFGRAEMAVRAAERRPAARLDSAKEDAEAALSRFHRAGLESLDLARESLGDLRRFVESESDKRFEFDADKAAARLRTFDEGVRRELAELELKPKDVEKIVAQLDEALERAGSGHPRDVIDYLSTKVDELYEVRAGDDRGMVDNIPWWKIVAVAVFFAVAIWALFRCTWGWFGPRCSPAEGLIYTLIAKAAAMGVKLC